MKEEKENMNIVFVGHVDHGKSTLIGRLLFDTKSLPEGKIEEIKATCEKLGKEMEYGFILDNLQEEREQGITIDTCQIFFNTKKRNYTIIDAPGHKEFIKNMITGASLAEAAILVVDVAEGVQEQTKRHAYVLSLLGVKQVIVALNKMDLKEFSQETFEKVKADTQAFLDSINIQPSYMIPISSKEGDNLALKSENMDWFEGPTLLEALDSFKIKEPETEKPLRLPIQDVYKFDDKRILAGRIETGTIKKGQAIDFLPSKSQTKIKTIEKFQEDRNEASAGECIGVTLEDPLFIERGEVACIKPWPKTAKEFKASLFWMSKEGFSQGDHLIFKCATQEMPCEITINRKIDSSTLELIEENSSTLKPTEVGELTIKTGKEVVFENFNDIQELGRFVLIKNNDVCAGGIITEA